jgi:Leucine-rich repeat (LRR) protein
MEGVAPPCVCIHCNESQVVAMCNHTGLQTIPTFHHLTHKIDYLMFFNNHLKNIKDKQFFKEVRNVVRLDLDHNDLITLPKDAFALLTRLQDLRISDNVYLDISQHVQTFFTIKTLRLLDISNTYFGASFAPDTFVRYPMPNLQRLYIHNSAMRFWSLQLFQPLKALNYIGLKLNDLSGIIINGSATTSVEYVDLEVNDLRYFPKTCLNGTSLSHFPKLKTLDLTSNAIRYLPYYAEICLPSLSNLTLNYNMIRYFDPGMFNESRFPSLTALSVDRLVEVHLISDFAFNNSRLQNLSFMYNNVDFSKPIVSDSAFLGLTGLRYLNLEHNFGLNNGRLAQLFADSTGLEYLRLGNTYLDTITPATFSRFPHLVFLELYHNPLLYLAPGSFDQLTRLQWLDLSSCWLVTLSPQHFAFHTRQHLHHLDLSDNNFR